MRLLNPKVNKQTAQSWQNGSENDFTLSSSGTLKIRGELCSNPTLAYLKK